MLKKSKQCTKRKSNTKIMKWLNSGPKKIYKKTNSKIAEVLPNNYCKTKQIKLTSGKTDTRRMYKIYGTTASCLQKIHFEPKDKKIECERIE